MTEGEVCTTNGQFGTRTSSGANAGISVNGNLPAGCQIAYAMYLYDQMVLIRFIMKAVKIVKALSDIRRITIKPCSLIKT